MLNHDHDEARKSRERDFHNVEFADNARESLSNAYRVTERAMARYHDRILEGARGATVLEYGCGPGTYSFQLAKVAKRVIGIDISEVAIAQARQRAVAAGATNAEFHVMDAEALTFPDGTFDLVVGRAILHHLDLRKSFSTIRSVLRPGCHAVFLEPLGHNPVLKMYRWLTPSMRTVDEHPMLVRDMKLAREYFDEVDIQPFVLTSLAAIPLAKTRAFDRFANLLERLDDQLLSIPLLQRYAWTSIWCMRRSQVHP